MDFINRDLHQLDIELHQVDELLYAFVDLSLGEADHALESEFLDAERSHGGAEDDGAFHVVEGDIARLRDVTDEAAGEGVARAGRIEHIFERKGGSEEHLLLVEEECTVFAFLDDQVTRTHLEDLLRGLHERVFFGEQPGFAVVDGEDIDELDGFHERVPLRFHPEVHRVHDDQLGAGAHALDDFLLQLGHEVAEHEELAILVRIGNDRVEVEEHVQLGVERVAGVHILVVAA